MRQLSTVPQLDEIDRRILRVLQKHGRIQNIELAERVGLSPSPCLRRVKLLEEAGVIEGYVALVDAAKVNLGMTLFARVWLTARDHETISRFTEEVKRLPEVVECHVVIGDCDCVLRVVTANLDDYLQFQINRLTRITGVGSVKTEIPMQKVKRTSELPI